MASGVDKPTVDYASLIENAQNNAVKPPPGSIQETEQKLNPANVRDAKNLQSAFEMSIFNMANTVMSQGQNKFKEILDESNKQEQRRKMVMGMVKSGLT